MGGITMKPLTIILTTLFLIWATLVQSQNNQIVDDIYFKPSDAKKFSVKNVTETKKPNFKNGAKEIIYIEKVIRDTVYVNAEKSDSAEYDEQGEYLNGFNGSESDLEYAERIRKFHNPKYTVFIGDPDYNSVFFLNSNDWNVYVEGSYAWVTPTWTNPYWYDYYWRPHSYNSWGWRNWWGSSYYNYYNPWYSFGMYGSWYGNYWDYGWGYNYPYSGWGYGYGYPYYGGYYGGYYNGWGYPYWGGGGTYRERNTAHSESERRNNNLYNSGRVGTQASNATPRQSSISGGGFSSPRSSYTAVSGENYRTSGVPTNGSTRTVRSGTPDNPTSRSTTTPTVTTGRNSYYSNENVNVSRPTTSSVSTSPRTTTSVSGNRTTENNRSTYTTQSGNRTTYSTGASQSAVRSSSSTTNSTSTSTRSSSPAYSSPATSSPSYSSSSSSGGSYSSGSSSSSSSGGSRGSSGGSSSGGRR